VQETSLNLIGVFATLVPAGEHEKITGNWRIGPKTAGYGRFLESGENRCLTRCAYFWTFTDRAFSNKDTSETGDEFELGCPVRLLQPAGILENILKRNAYRDTSPHRTPE